MTAGPGLLNVLTALASAALDEIPLILVNGVVPTFRVGQGGLQEGSPHGLDVAAVVRPLCKAHYEILHGDSVDGVVTDAVERALAEPQGPVVLPTTGINNATGHTQEALEYLAALQSAWPGIEGLDETIGDLVALENLGDSKEN